MARLYSIDTDGGLARIESDLSAEAAVTSSMPAGLYAATASGNIYRAPNAGAPVFSLFAAHGSELRHMALLPDGSGMLVCARASKKILSIDSGGTITDLFSTGTDDPYCIGIASGGAHDGQIFVGCLVNPHIAPALLQEPRRGDGCAHTFGVAQH